MMLPAASRNKGFTLVELLVVIAITLLLAAATVPIYGSLQVSSQLNENTSQIVQNLRTARERSVARLNNAQHGIYFTTNSYTLYQGSSYASRSSTYDRGVTLDPALSFSLPGGALTYDINFSKGLGVPNAIGTISLTHDVTGSRQIIINNLGMVEEE